MTDFDLDTLAAQWTSAEPRSEPMLAGFRRHQRAMWMSALRGIGSILILVAILAWTLIQAIRFGGAERWLVASAFLLALPPTAYFTLLSYRQARQRFDISTQGALQRERARLVTVRHLILSGRVCAAILVAASVALVVLGLAGAVPMSHLGKPVAAWLATAAVVWLWQRRRNLRLKSEVQTVEQMLAQYREADDDQQN